MVSSTSPQHTSTGLATHGFGAKGWWTYSRGRDSKKRSSSGKVYDPGAGIGDSSFDVSGLREPMNLPPSPYHMPVQASSLSTPSSPFSIPDYTFQPLLKKVKGVRSATDGSTVDMYVSVLLQRESLNSARHFSRTPTNSKSPRQSQTPPPTGPRVSDTLMAAKAETDSGGTAKEVTKVRWNKSDDTTQGLGDQDVLPSQG